MIIDKNYPGLIDGYKIEGDLISKENIEIKLNCTLYVTGEVKTGLGIEAGWGIKAGRGIKAGQGIKTGLGIECLEELIVKYSIFAGICWWREIEESDLEIRCGKFIGDKSQIRHGNLIETAMVDARNDWNKRFEK